MKLGVWSLVLASICAAPAFSQQFSARFFTDYGSPFKGERIVFAPTSFYMAVLVDDHHTHIFHVDSGRETKKYAVHPVAMAFAAKGYRLLAVGEQHTVLLPVDDSLAVDAPWRLPAGYLGITFTQHAGKLLIESLAPGGPAAVSNQIRVGDELVGVVVAGEEQSVLGWSIPSVIKKLAGLAGTNAILRIVPRGAADAKNVTLRRAAGTKQNNQVRFQAWSTRSSPQSLVVRQQNALLVIDADEATPISAIEPQEIEPFGFQTFSTDGKLLAVTGHRRHPVEGEPKLGLEVFDVARQTRLLFAPVDTTTLYEQRFTADGKRILWGAKDRILVYDLERRAFAAPILIGFDPSRYKLPEKKEDDEYFSPLNLNARYDDQRRDDDPTVVEYPEQLLVAFDVSPDGKLVAVGSAHGELRVWSTSEHKELARIGERTQKFVDVKPVRFSPDGKWLAYYLEGTLHWQTVTSILADHSAP
jgi:hypothetical protein